MSIARLMQMAASGQGGEPDPYFNQTVLLLHGDGTNGAQNNTFLDSSSNNFTITRNGNTTQGTFSPFSGPDGYWSNFFDGTNDRLTIADNAALRPGTSAFTIEAWVYRAAAGAAHTIFAKGASTPTGFAFLITSSDTLRFTDTSTDITSTGTVAANTWVHVAAVREGTGSNQLKLYINGVQDGTGTSSTDFTQTEEARIGENRGATDDFQGYISNFRYVIGTALYTSGFTPSTSPLTTTSQGATSSQVELLTCQSNRFLDNSTNGFTISPVNNTSVQPFSPFLPTAEYDASVNGGSGYFDGSGDFLSVADNAALDLGSGDFTLEMWIYPSVAASSDERLFKKFDANSGYGFFFQDTSTKLRFIVRNGSGGNAVDIEGSGVITAAWNHLAVTRSGNTWNIWINGTSVANTTNSASVLDNGDALTISGNDALFEGFISNARVVKGTAVYTSAFTPPTSPLTAITNTSLLCNFTNAGIFDNTGKNNLETVGNAQIDTTTKKYGTGSMEFDGTGDGLLISNSPNLLFGTGDFTIEFWYRGTVSTGNQFVVSKYTTYGSVMAYTVAIIRNNHPTNPRGVFVYVGATDYIAGNNLIQDDIWYHIAVTRSSGDVRIFVDGTQINVTAANANDITDPANLVIGITNEFNNPVNGYVDDLRITKGVARYTSNFTPPSAAFPNL